MLLLVMHEDSCHKVVQLSDELLEEDTLTNNIMKNGDYCPV